MKFFVNVISTLVLIFLCFILSAVDTYAVTAIDIAKEPRVDVRAFGAKGDGTTNDRQAIIKAQNSITHGVVYFPKGNYVIWGLPLKSNITYLGDGATLDLGPTNRTGSAGVIADTVSNVTFKGFKLEGRRSQATGVSGDGSSIGIFIRGASNISVISCIISNWYTDGINIGRNDANEISRNIRIIDCISTNSRRNNLSIVHADSVYVERGEYTNANGTSPQAGIDIEPDSNTCSNIFIKGAKVTGNASGVGVAITGNIPYLAENVTVEECLGPNAIVVNIGYAKGKIIVKNNRGATIQHWNYSGMYNNPLMDLVLEGNILEGLSTPTGQQAAILIQSGRSVKLVNNVIKNSQRNAVKVDMKNVADIELSGNKSYVSNRVGGKHATFYFENTTPSKKPRLYNNYTEGLNGGVELEIK